MMEKNKKTPLQGGHRTILTGSKRNFKCLWLLLTFVFSSGLSTSYGEQKIYSTWEGFEADKLASIWLIKRFIAPGASVVIYPKGQVIKEGIQFDTPNSEITRKFNKSTFETLIDYYRIKDKKLINIGKLIHDTEINTWERKVFKRTRELEIRILDLLEKHKNNEEIIARACQYFDSLYTAIPIELEPH
jgi:hypothetical protein